MKQFFKYLDGLKKECVMAPLFKMLEAFFDLLVPLVVAAIINHGIAGKSYPAIWKNILLLVALALIGLTCSVTAQYFAANASVRFAARVRQAAFDHVLGLSYSQLDELGTGSLITRLTADINQMQTGVNMTLRLLLRSPFIVFGSMIMAFTINVRCALVFAAAIPVLAVVVYGIMLVSIPLYKKVQSALDAVTVRTRENLTGVRVIRAFGQEREEVKEFDRLNGELTRTNEFVGRIAALMNPLTYALINIATIVLIRIGAVQVNLGTLQQGDVVALYNYMAQVIVELIKLASLIVTINKALACSARVGMVMAMEPEMEDVQTSGSDVADPAAAEKGTPAKGMAGGNDRLRENGLDKAGSIGPGRIRFEQVSFTYRGAGDETLTDISFEAKPGEVIGIIGGTGSGKSTLVQLIPRFYDVTAGRVLVDGVDVRQIPRETLLARVGIVPQKAVLFAGSIRDNLRWGNEQATDAELMAAVEAAQAGEVVAGKEGGLDHILEAGGRNLSGGQRQRLTIARTLVKKPGILILDDSASALDFATDAALRRAIRGMAGTTTTLIVSQRCSSIQSADRILVLQDGQLVGSGRHEQLLESCEEYQEIYYSQYPEKRHSSEGGERPAPQGGVSAVSDHKQEAFGDVPDRAMTNKGNRAMTNKGKGGAAGC
ncbi:MAG: ABC transporter ATP-binding protein [Lachnospiraceae bacterium]|nr:ABC transporter ATP-binding protein [Lachnospiraceae bacterium]